MCEGIMKRTYLTAIVILVGLVTIIGTASAVVYSEQLTPTMTSNTAPSPYVAMASSEYTAPGYAAFKVFDHTTTGGANTFWASSAGGTQWLQLNFSGQTNVARYTIYPGDIAGGTPCNFTLSGSNDGISWSTLNTQTGITGWVRGAGKTFNFTNSTTSYDRLRLTITDNQAHDGGLYRVGELYFYDWLPFPYTIPNSTHTILVYNQTGNGDWVVPTGVTNIRLLVIGGGGNGGNNAGGGGGAGGVISYDAYSVSPGEIWNISVGGSHANSSFNKGTVIQNIAWRGGNGGISTVANPENGGSGGGGHGSATGATTGGTG